jgi:hypothetical protein
VAVQEVGSAMRAANLEMIAVASEFCHHVSIGES